MKILILGIGGIGGFFGGYLQESGADVTFLVRQKRKDLLLENGLKVISPIGNLKLKPNLILADELKPIYDIILISCKTYDLDQAILDLKLTKGKGVIIPFLNGMTHLKKLDKAFGSENVMGGVAHISSTINEDGTIEHFSKFKKLTFGNRVNDQNNVLKPFLDICKKTKFDVSLSEDINLDLWKKWIFISTVAGATTLFSTTLGKISGHKVGKKTLINLYKECRTIAKLNGFIVEDNEANNILHNITASGSPIKASMQRDVEKKAPAEHEEIFGHLISKAKNFNFESPILTSCYLKMKLYEEKLN
jgi:2-dehydropantoate 2-reductase